MKTLILAAIRCSLMFTAVAGSLVCVQPAQAYTVTLRRMGANVVANGSGAINLTGLTFTEFSNVIPHIQANFDEFGPASVEMGTAGPGKEELYEFGSTGPTSFGSGGLFLPNTSSGDAFGFIAPNPPGFAAGIIFVPFGYVSGTALSDSMTFNDTTFASLGVTPGTYVWSWGNGANQRFTLIIGGARVPDGGSTISLLGFALVGLAALRRKFSC